MMMVSFMMKPPFGPSLWTDRFLRVRLVRESPLTPCFLVVFPAMVRLLSGAAAFDGRDALPLLEHAPCQPWSRGIRWKSRDVRRAVPPAQAICPRIEVAVPEPGHVTRASVIAAAVRVPRRHARSGSGRC